MDKNLSHAMSKDGRLCGGGLEGREDPRLWLVLLQIEQTWMHHPTAKQDLLALISRALVVRCSEKAIRF